MEKISKFSWMAENNKQELLLYNSYIGEYSLCKLTEYENIKKVLSGKLNDLQPEVIEKLKEKGIIVSCDVDEKKLLDIQYYRIMSPRVMRLTINPTEACNFACKYCYEEHMLTRMTEKTQDDILAFVGSNIQNYIGIHVSWFGGEPLVNKESLAYISKRLIKTCGFYKRKYTADMTTNAFMLDYDTFNEMLDYKINKFQITIDGTEEIHDRFRVLKNGNGTYKQIMKNLYDIKCSKRKDFTIIIRVNFTEKLFDVFDDFYKSIEDFISDERFYVSFYTVKDIEGTADIELKNDILDNDKNPMQRIYNMIYDKPKSLNIRKDLLNPGMGLCYGGKRDNFVIKSDGSVYKCTIDFEDKSNQVGMLIDGNMKLFNKYYSYIADRQKCEKYYSCFFAPVCTGDPCPKKNKNSKKCSFIKENIDVVLSIIDKYDEFEVLDGGHMYG